MNRKIQVDIAINRLMAELNLLDNRFYIKRNEKTKSMFVCSKLKDGTDICRSISEKELIKKDIRAYAYDTLNEFNEQEMYHNNYIKSQKLKRANT